MSADAIVQAMRKKSINEDFWQAFAVGYLSGMVARLATGDRKAIARLRLAAKELIKEGGGK